MRRLVSALSSVNRFSLTLATTAAVIASLFVGIPLLDLIELRTYDLRFLSRGAIEPSSNVVVATIDEKSLDELGRWPWPRRRFADLVDRLSADGAKVIAFDVGFLEPEEGAGEGGSGDETLVRAIRESSAAVILGYFFHMSDPSRDYRIADDEIERRLRSISGSAYPVVMYRDPSADDSALPRAYAPEPNLPILTEVARASGYFSVRQDADGVVRWMPLVIRAGEDLFPPLSVLAMQHYLGGAQAIVKIAGHGVDGLTIGDRAIATDDKGRMLLNYYGPPKTFRHVPISDILRGEVEEGAFRGRIVVVGATATGLYDARSTPFATVFPGAEIHATAIENLIAGSFLEKPAWTGVVDIAAIVILAAISAVVLSRFGATAGLLVTAAVFGLYVLAARLAFVRLGVWINVVYPLFGLIASYTVLTAYSFLSEQRERRKIRDTFGRYVAPIVIEEMLKDPDRLKLGGEEKVLTVLFSDLQGFTSYSEKYTPQQMIELLSEYYARMTEKVFEHEGMLKEYVGDELMAIFGAPIDHADHAVRACAAALEMRDRRHSLTEEWAKVGRPPLNARTGVNSGPMLVGNLGSEYRFAYGVLGDNVNLGSRLEGLNKQYGTEILIGEGTADLIGDAFVLREVDMVRVVGKKKPTRIFELVGKRDDGISGAHQSAHRSYARALEAYRAQRWQEAIELLTAALADVPDDGPSLVLLERCRDFSRTPPAGDWDGVYEATKK